MDLPTQLDDIDADNVQCLNFIIYKMPIIEFRKFINNNNISKGKLIELYKTIIAEINENDSNEKEIAKLSNIDRLHSVKKFEEKRDYLFQKKDIMDDFGDAKMREGNKIFDCMNVD